MNKRQKSWHVINTRDKRFFMVKEEDDDCVGEMVVLEETGDDAAWFIEGGANTNCLVYVDVNFSVFRAKSPNEESYRIVFRVRDSYDIDCLWPVGESFSLERIENMRQSRVFELLFSELYQHGFKREPKCDISSNALAFVQE